MIHCRPVEAAISWMISSCKHHRVSNIRFLEVHRETSQCSYSMFLLSSLAVFPSALDVLTQPAANAPLNMFPPSIFHHCNLLHGISLSPPHNLSSLVIFSKRSKRKARMIRPKRRKARSVSKSCHIGAQSHAQAIYSQNCQPHFVETKACFPELPSVSRSLSNPLFFQDFLFLDWPKHPLIGAGHIRTTAGYKLGRCFHPSALPDSNSWQLFWPGPSHCLPACATFR